MKLTVVMPFLNGKNFTLQALGTLKTSLPVKFLLLDNGSTDGTAEIVQSTFGIWTKDLNIIDSEYVFGNRSVAQSWNYGIRESLDSDYILIVNNDVIFHPKTIDNLVKFMDKTNYAMVTARNVNDGNHTPTDLLNMTPLDFDPEDLKPITNWREEGPDFSCFLIKPSFVKDIGWFDENFYPAYYEDNDAHTRIVKAGLHAKRVSTAPYFHFGSTTINQNPQVKKVIQNTYFEKNKQYFIQKWGAEPSAVLDQMGFNTPFNDPDKTIKYWQGCEQYESL